MEAREPYRLDDVACPKCGKGVDEHEAGDCMDDWVRTVLFSGDTTYEARARYSQNSVHAMAILLVAARSYAVRTIDDNGTVQALIGFGAQTYAAKGDTFALAVCRAALKAARARDASWNVPENWRTDMFNSPNLIDNVEQFIRRYYDARQMVWPSTKEALLWAMSEIGEAADVELMASNRDWVRNNPSEHNTTDADFAEELGDAIMMLLVAGYSRGLDPLRAMLEKAERKMLAPPGAE